MFPLFTCFGLLVLKLRERTEEVGGNFIRDPSGRGLHAEPRYYVQAYILRPLANGAIPDAVNMWTPLHDMQDDSYLSPPIDATNPGRPLNLQILSVSSQS